jgi:hypothetical protein
VSVILLITLVVTGNTGLVEAAVTAVREVQTAWSTPPVPTEKAQPLTDVAPAPPAVAVRSDEAPTARLQGLGLESLPAQAQGQLPPGWTKEQVANPPQWTTRIAGPGAQQEYGPRGLQLRETVPGRASRDAIVPPDPFTPPPLVVNPERGAPAISTPAAIAPQPVPPEKIAPPPAPVEPGDTIQPVEPDIQ